MRKRAITRQQFIDAATRLYAEHGYRGATIRNICIEAKRSVGALYMHFHNKEDLFRREGALVEEALRDACASSAHRKRQLRRIGERVVEHRRFLRLLVADDQQRVGEGDRLAVKWVARLRKWSPSIDGLHVIHALRQAAGQLFFVKGERVPKHVRRVVVDAFVRQPPTALLA